MKKAILILTSFAFLIQNIEGQSHRFHDTYIIMEFSGQELAQFDRLEGKFMDGIKSIIEKKEFLDFYDVYAPGDWTAPLTLAERQWYSPDSIKITNKYELSLVWDNSYENVEIIGFSRLYEYVVKYYGRGNVRVTRPLYRIPICSYDKLLNQEDNKELRIFIVQSLMDKISSDTLLRKNKTNASQRLLKVKDFEFLPQAPLVLLSDLLNNAAYEGTALGYGDVDLTKKLTRDEIHHYYFEGSEWYETENGERHEVNAIRQCAAIIIAEMWKNAPMSDTLTAPLRNRMDYVCQDSADLYVIKRQIDAIGLILEYTNDYNTVKRAILWFSYDHVQYAIQNADIELSLFESQFVADLIKRTDLQNVRAGQY